MSPTVWCCRFHREGLPATSPCPPGENIRGDLDALAARVAKLEAPEGVPPVCTGSGTTPTDLPYGLVPSTGLCGICSKKVPLHVSPISVACVVHAYERKRTP